jgi:dihydroorotate dehydrogenase electron transfer subunit
MLVLRNVGFARLWVGQFLSLFADWALRALLLLWVYRLTHSGVGTSLVGLAESFTWGRVQRDDALLITGPVGRPFQVDKRVRRALLVDDGAAVAPLLYLLHRLVELSVEVTYLAIRRDPGDGVPARALPPEIEYIAIEAAGIHEANAGLAARIETLLPWADSLYLALDFESLPHILNALRRGLMRLRKGFAQAIVLPDLLPCGVGACDLCTIVTREGYRRVCRDGLVFDLLTLH